jgi:TolB-like protein
MFNGIRGKSSGFRSALCTLHSALIFRFAFLGVAAMLCGCEVPGVILHVLVGEPPVAAQYNPPKDKPILVLVENYRSPDDERIDSDQIAHQVRLELKKEAKLDVINPEKVEEMREEDAQGYRKMNIAAVGKAADAKYVLYVDLLESAVSKDSTAGAIHALATARVKVVDTDTGKTVWPLDSAQGKEVSESVEFDNYEDDRAVAMHTEMLTRLSSKIAKMFYTWKPDDQYQEDAGG